MERQPRLAMSYPDPTTTDASARMDRERAELLQYKQWYLELIAVILTDRPEGENECPDPRIVVKNLHADVERLASYASKLRLAMRARDEAVASFCRGVVKAPWTSREPRVVGFKAEFIAMINAISTEYPNLAGREQSTSEVHVQELHVHE